MLVSGPPQNPDRQKGTLDIRQEGASDSQGVQGDRSPGRQVGHVHSIQVSQCVHEHKESV